MPMVLFEVYLNPGVYELSLSEELLRETKAQVMTYAQAVAVGLEGLPPPKPGQEMRLVAVADRDSKWVTQSLNAHGDVGNFRAHNIED